MSRIAFVLAGLALATGVPATAAAAEDLPAAKVYFSDLNLRTDAGVKTLDDRLRRAITRLCGGAPRGGHLENVRSRRCRDMTLADVTPARDDAVRLARTEGAVRVTRLELKTPVFD